jgi:hypothetical protein
VIVSSKEGRKKIVWRQFCECLSEAAAHLTAAVSQLLLEALLIVDIRDIGVGALLVSPFNVEWECYAQPGGVEESKFCLFRWFFL